ncbi:MAG TPA: hypothetical protein VIT23_13255, partial [Terrimicrobiaceae bacterium]
MRFLVSSIWSRYHRSKDAPGSRKLARKAGRNLQISVFAGMVAYASSLPAFSNETASARIGKPTAPAAQTLIIDGIWGSHKRWERLRSRIAKEVGPCKIWRYDNSGRASIESL